MKTRISNSFKKLWSFQPHNVIVEEPEGKEENSSKETSNKEGEFLSPGPGKTRARLASVASQTRALRSAMIDNLNSKAASTFLDESVDIETLSPEERRERLRYASRVQRDFHQLFKLFCEVEQCTSAESAMPVIIQYAYTLLKADRVSLFRFEQSSQDLVCEYSKDIVGTRVALTSGIVGKCATTGELYNILDTNECSFFNSDVDKQSSYTTKSVLCAPIFNVQGHVVAVLEAINKIEGCFDATDEYVIGLIAFFAGDAFTKSIMLEDAQAATRKAQRLLDVVKALGTARSEGLTQFIEKIANLAYQVVEADKVSVFVVDTLHQELWCTTQDNVLQGVRLPMTEGVIGKVATSGSIINLRDKTESAVQNASFDLKANYHTESVLCLPIFDDKPSRPGIKKKPIAVLQALNSAKGSFDEDDVEILKAFCKEAGSALGSKSFEFAFTKAHIDSRSQTVDFLSSFYEQSAHFKPTLQRRISSGSWMTGADQRHKTTYNTWGLPVFSFDTRILLEAATSFFTHFDLLEKLNIPKRKFDHFLLDVMNLYNPTNPFHNFYHAFSVLHVTFMIISTTDALGQVLNLHDIFSMLVAAICHDVDHPGVSNSYLIKTKDERALMYNDISVLENYHAATTFRLLSNEENDILVNFTDSDKIKIRKMIIQAILSTDMAHHYEMLADLEKVSKPSKENPEDRELMRNSIVHMADLSAQTMPTQLAMSWGDRVISEFKTQAELEKSKGVKLEPFFASLEDQGEIAKLQLNFVDIFVIPLWKILSEMFPEPFAEAMSNLEQNRQTYALACTELSSVSVVTTFYEPK